MVRYAARQRRCREHPTESHERKARRRSGRDDLGRHQRSGPDRPARHARRRRHLAGGRARRRGLRRSRQPDARLRPLGEDLGRQGDGQRLRHDLPHARSRRPGHRGAARRHARPGGGGRRGRQVRAARQARHVHQPPGLRRGRLLQDGERPEPPDRIDRGHRRRAQPRRDRQGRSPRCLLRGAERPGHLDGPHRKHETPGRPEDRRRRDQEDRRGRPGGRHARQLRQRRALHADGRALRDDQLLPLDPGGSEGADRARGRRRAGLSALPRTWRALMDRVRLAIVGCGNICQLNAPGYLEHPGCDVVALCDTERARAELRARQWGITPRIYKDYAELLDASTVDAAELLTPTYLHAEQIIAALAAGKHVSCQKPIAVSVAEADRIAEAVSKARTTFRVTENFLYYPPIVKAKELLDAGVIGEPSLVRIHTTRAKEIVGATLTLDPEALVWRRDPGRNPGGALYDDGVHKYATAMYWIGDIGEVSAIVSYQKDFLQEVPSVAHWRFKDRDCLGIIDYTYAPDMPIRSRYYKADEFFEIHGTRGILWVTRCTGEMLDLPPVMLIKGTETTSFQVPMDWRTGFDGAARDFIDGILEGRQPAQDVQTAKKVLQVPLAIYEANRLRRPVSPDSMT